MSGIAENNFPAFNAAAGRLRSLGFSVVNPAEISVSNPGDWHSCLRADIQELCGCDWIALLPGWERSQGAHLETHVAHRLGIKVFMIEDVPGYRDASHQ